MRFNFSKGSRRNTPCYELEIGGATIYISYQTVIAISFSVGDGAPSVRRHNEWGPTTGRHMNDMGVRGWPEVSEEEIERRLELAIMQAGLTIAARRMGAAKPGDVVDECMAEATH